MKSKALELFNPKVILVHTREYMYYVVGHEIRRSIWHWGLLAGGLSAKYRHRLMYFAQCPAGSAFVTFASDELSDGHSQ